MCHSAAGTAEENVESLKRYIVEAFFGGTRFRGSITSALPDRCNLVTLLTL